MQKKLIITLKDDALPHLPLNKFVEIIRRDNEMTEETRTLLLSLKKARATYVPLPLKHELIIDERFKATFHRDLKPIQKIWTMQMWTENNKKEYIANKAKFIKNLIDMYNEMGYQTEMDIVEDIEVDNILDTLSKLAKKTLKRIDKIKK